jgi:hypothetical protein
VPRHTLGWWQIRVVGKDNMAQGISEQWRALCEIEQQARRAYFRTFRKVHRKFAAIGAGQSRENPTMDEIASGEKAHKRWQAALKDMREFAKAHAR